MLERQVAGRLEAALARAEQAEARYQPLVDQPPAITYTEALDSGRVISVSPQVETILGYTQEELLSNPRLWVDCSTPTIGTGSSRPVSSPTGPDSRFARSIG
jgi:PAS domain-containing protein